MVYDTNTCTTREWASRPGFPCLRSSPCGAPTSSQPQPWNFWTYTYIQIHHIHDIYYTYMYCIFVYHILYWWSTNLLSASTFHIYIVILASQIQIQIEVQVEIQIQDVKSHPVAREGTSPQSLCVRRRPWLNPSQYIPLIQTRVCITDQQLQMKLKILDGHTCPCTSMILMYFLT